MNSAYIKNKAQIYQWRYDNKNAYNEYQRKLVSKRYASSRENNWARIVRSFRKLGPELFQ